MNLLELTEMVHENRKMLFNGGLDEYLAMLFVLSKHL